MLNHLRDNDVTLFVTDSLSPALVSFLQDDFNFESWVRLLSLQDQMQVHSISDTSLRRKSLVQRLFTKVILNGYVAGSNPTDDLQFSYNRFGKPILPGIDFNISTSNDLIVIAVSTIGEIGVDLSHHKQEAVSPTEFMSQFGEMFHPVEKTFLDLVSDSYRKYVLFNQLWTMKEAFSKCLGLGLNFDLPLLGFRFDDDIVLQDSLVLKTDFFDVGWSSNIDVILENELLACPLINPDKPFKVKSACLSTSSKFPVLVSVVTQYPTDPMCVNVNLVEVIEKMLNSN